MTDGFDMDNQPADNTTEQKVFSCIALLEQTNKELITTLKHCVRLMDQFTEMVPEPEEWQKMLLAFQATIEIGEGIAQENPLH